MLQQMCRTCLATCGELVPIFSNDYYVHNLPDKLFNTTRIEILQNDDLPKMICKKCIFLVDSLYCFKYQCEMADIKLRKTLKYSFYSDMSPLKNISPNKAIVEDLKAEEHSDIGTSSEEEYHIEYASEEARLEVENARRRCRNAKKKRNKQSGVKVKSVEIVPTQTKNYKNFNATSSYTYEVSVPTVPLNKKINALDSDEESSMYVTEQIEYTSNKSVKDDDEVSSTDETLQVKSKTRDYSREKVGFIKSGSKRKLENDFYSGELSKVPKKVLFKHSHYTDENMQYIEVADNQDINSDNNLRKIEDNSNSIVELNVLENDAEKIDRNYDVTLDKDSGSKSSKNSLSPYKAKKSITEEDDKILFELRLQNLIQQVVLNIPEICTTCMKHFDSYAELLKHKIEAHSKEDHFHCPACYEKFSNNSSLITHLNEHTDVLFNICLLCSGEFYSTETMRAHLNSHADVLGLKCHICLKQFSRISKLLYHIGEHTVTSSLACIICSNNFNNIQSLQLHLNNKHKKIKQNTRIKGQASRLSVSMEENKKQDTTILKFPCPYCERSFSVKANLREHVFTHLGAQQYSCLVCEKVFDTQEERTEHTQIHMKPQQKNDRKKFRCRICHEILISRVSYGQHLKNKHWNSKQTNEILKELSDSFMNEKVNEKINKSSTQPVTDIKSSV